MNPPAQPLFSILVPTYNHAAYLPAALDSLLAQTDPDWEAVVVNDGSTDASGRIADDYARRDPRVRVFHKKNGGVSSALNAGLREARGQWILWLSSDDLFDSRKVETHREWIRREPRCRFFFTHFRALDSATGAVSDPDLWRPLPDRRFQILAMLRGTFIQGISVCVHREALAQAGSFDEMLRVSQDYDMWLRVLSGNPAVFIDARTCTARHHASQDSHTQRDRCFFEAAAAGIRLLNRHPFGQLAPLADLCDPAVARLALDQALATAASPHSFVYGLGPHLALVHRIMEWLLSPDAPAHVAALRRYFAVRCVRAARSQAGNDLGFVWRVAAVAAESGNPCPYTPVEFGDVGRSTLARRRRSGRGGKTLEAFLERMTATAPVAAPVIAGSPEEVVTVCHPGARVDSPVRYGALRMTLQTARYLQTAGCRVLLLGEGSGGMGTAEGVPFIGARDDADLRRSLELWRPRDALVAVSRSDAARWTRPRRLVFYHHSISFIPGNVTAGQIARLGAVTVCASQYSRGRMLAYGLPADRTFAVPNCYDARVFTPEPVGNRAPRSLIHVGHPCYGKGTDLVLRAFESLRETYPDAILDVYGDSDVPWSEEERTGLPAGWFDGRHRLNWDAITMATPGVRYWGRAPSEAVAAALRASSLLVLPSRENCGAENAPLVVLEAQACGCIPVVPRTGGVPELVQDGVTAYVYGSNTAEALAARIRELWALGLPDEGQRRNAQAWVRATFTRERSGESFLRILASAVPGIRVRWSASVLRFRWWAGERVRRQAT